MTGERDTGEQEDGGTRVEGESPKASGGQVEEGSKALKGKWECG